MAVNSELQKSSTNCGKCTERFGRTQNHRAVQESRDKRASVNKPNTHSTMATRGAGVRVIESRQKGDPGIHPSDKPAARGGQKEEGDRAR